MEYSILLTAWVEHFATGSTKQKNHRQYNIAQLVECSTVSSVPVCNLTLNSAVIVNAVMTMAPYICHPGHVPHYNYTVPLIRNHAH